MAKKGTTPLSPGTSVMTTEPNLEKRSEWTDAAWKKRRWGVRGRIFSHSDAHGLCYKIRHADGEVAWYDPSEFTVLKMKKGFRK